MKSKGRPKGPEKVIYKRRVFPEWVARLDALIGSNGAVRDVGLSHPAPEPIKAPLPVASGEVAELKKTNWQLVEENERLTATIADLEIQLSNALETTEDEKALYWKQRTIAAEKRVGELLS